MSPLLLVLLIAAAEALFAGTPGVVELKPEAVEQFVKGHRPAFMVVYADWCGHCKALHPTWARLGKAMEGMVSVGAVNGDTHKSFSAEYNVRGFPTILYWPAGAARGGWKVYEGERTFEALRDAMSREVKGGSVLRVGDKEADAVAAMERSGKAGVILFTMKRTTGVLYRALSASPRLSAGLFFLAAEAKTAPRTVARLALMDKFPMIATVSVVPDRAGEGRVFALNATYKGAMEYKPIAKFLLAAIGGEEEPPETANTKDTKNPTSGKKDAASGKKDAASGKKDAASGKKDAASGKKDAASEARQKDAAEGEEPAAKKKYAHPVGPTSLEAHSLERHCAHGALKVRQQSPLCVVSFHPTVALDTLQQRYGHDSPFLLFDATADGGEAPFVDQLRAQLGGQPLGVGDVLLLRAFKTSEAKVAIFRGADADDPTERLSTFLGKVLAGDVTFSKLNTFPTIK